ncbi:hypothetical protein D4764_18G0001690 [Takifugu flavidus]|uniref:Reverse transcriptase domain-containing protein n=1 Tax=Takifugu flavidus TaxID=433684 RepID=A0A5C6NQ52_9TELE|nr:hypothetical protein D4764_18G0001690 [Takifugu flavidus]
MREQGEADGQSASEEKFRGKGCKRKRSGSTSSPLTNRCRNQSRGTHAGGRLEQSLTFRIKAALSPAVLKRIKIMVAAAATGYAVLNIHQSVKLIKFADDTTLIALISNGDETAYRREVARLVSWCGHNNLQLNAEKTVEMIVDFRKVTAPLPPLALMDSPITTVDSFRFLGTTITRDLKWEPTISSLIKKAQQRMFFLRQLRKLKLPPRMLAQFYTAIIESILTSSITVWFAGATVRDRLRLQRVVRAAEKVNGCRLPSIQDLYISRTRRCAGRITADPSHPGHGLFSPLPSGRRLRSIRTKTSRYIRGGEPFSYRGPFQFL